MDLRRRFIGSYLIVSGAVSRSGSCLPPAPPMIFLMQMTPPLTVAGSPRLRTGLVAPLPASQAQAAADPDSDIVLKLGFVLLMLDVFLEVSRAMEILTLQFGVTVPYLVTAVHGATFLFAMIGGRLRPMVTSRAGLCLALFTCWMLLCTPVSSWKGGSVNLILHQWLPSAMGFLSCGLVVTLAQCRRMAYSVAAGVTFMTIASLFFSTIRLDRLALEGGTLGNANDLAMLLLMGAPFLLIVLTSRDAGRIMKVLAIGAGAALVLVMGRTGSRSGLVAVVAMTVAMFLVFPLAGKIKVAAATLILGSVFLLTTPSYVLLRYATMFSSSDKVEEVAADAIASTEIRQQVLEESIDMTLENPVFGVGPGVFVAAAADEAKEEGRRADWRVSHNTYTQVSSEMGIPGLLFYVAAMAAAFLNAIWLRRHGSADPSGQISALGLVILLALISTTVSFAFSSNAYMVYLPLLIGLSVAFRSAAERELLLHPASAFSPMRPVAVAKAPAPDSKPPAASRTSARPAEHRFRLLGRPRRARR
jgi:O-antigen ligase